MKLIEQFIEDLRDIFFWACLDKLELDNIFHVRNIASSLKQIEESLAVKTCLSQLGTVLLLV